MGDLKNLNFWYFCYYFCGGIVWFMLGYQGYKGQESVNGKSSRA